MSDSIRDFSNSECGNRLDVTIEEEGLEVALRAALEFCCCCCEPPKEEGFMPGAGEEEE